MRNFKIFMANVYFHSNNTVKKNQQQLLLRLRNWSIPLLLGLSLTTGVAKLAKAQITESIPPELNQVLVQMDVVASQGNVDGLAKFYSDQFTNSDNLNRQDLFAGLKLFWDRYDQLNYRTKLESWNRNGDEIIAETTTLITGTQELDGRTINLESTLRSRQRLVNGKIVYQEILAESTKLFLGNNPPQVQVRLPERVLPGQQYSFDAIVTEPLGGDLLIGGAIDEPVGGDRYLNPAAIELNVLPAGGIFKIGKAPLQPVDQWISAVIVRGDGITVVSQRLRVVDRAASR